MAIVDIKLPKYTVTLPVSKSKVEYRPFTVKESKILMLAQEDGKTESIVSAVNQIISNCTFGKQDVTTLNKVDAEYLFVQLRNKSMGEGVDIRATCKECKHKTQLQLNLEDVKVENADLKLEPIKVMEDIWVTLRYPTINESLSADAEDGSIAIALSLDTFIEGENVKHANDYTMQERIDFVESLTDQQILLFKPFFDKFPTLSLDMDYKCKCGVDNHIHIEGIENLF